MASESRCECFHPTHYHGFDGHKYTYCRFPKCQCAEFKETPEQVAKEQGRMM